jgi:hypothetical protein
MIRLLVKATEFSYEVSKKGEKSIKGKEKRTKQNERDEGRN